MGLRAWAAAKWAFDARRGRAPWAEWDSRADVAWVADRFRWLLAELAKGWATRGGDAADIMSPRA
jgi:hypothetical protein